MRAWLLVAFVCAFGCGSPSVEDDLTVTVDDTAGALKIDTNCDSSCGGDTDVGVVISYDNPNNTRTSKETVELEQYRVDYSLIGLHNVPFFAADISGNHIALSPGASENITVPVVGQAQRDFVRKAAGGKAISGTATLKFAGYDFNNKQLFIDTDFNVSLDDFAGAHDGPVAGAGDGQ
jgi:hypothetical protein